MRGQTKHISCCSMRGARFSGADMDCFESKITRHCTMQRINWPSDPYFLACGCARVVRVHHAADRHASVDLRCRKLCVPEQCGYGLECGSMIVQMTRARMAQQM